VEIEAKFSVPDEATFERLKATDELAGFRLAGGAGRQVRDTYLDTPDRTVTGAGWFCRRRRRGGSLLITCKQLTAPDDEVHRREELEVRLPREAPPAEWPQGAARELVVGLVGEAALQPLVELRQMRLARRALKNDTTVAEVSLDRVVVATADGDRPPYFEVEVELATGGAEADLAAIVASLRDEWRLTPQPRSKFERALEAAGAGGGPAAEEAAGAPPGAPAASAPSRPAPPTTPAAKPAPAPRRPRRPGLRADDPMAEAARKTLRFHYRHMLDHEAGTRLGDDPEELHDMRVATRRMRAAFRVFGAHLDPAVVRPHISGLRRTGRALGAVRDLDVIDEKTQAYLAALPDERRGELDPLVDAWRAERGAARERLLTYLDGDRFARFKDEFGVFLDTAGAGALPHLLPDGEALPDLVWRVLPAALYERAAAVWAYGGPLAEPDPPLTRFHRLRIAGKFLRYTLEFFEEALGPDARPLIRSTKRLQDHLGDLQDSVVACQILRNFLTWGTWAAPAGRKAQSRASAVVVAPGVAAYLAFRQDELQKLVATFPESWSQIAGLEFSEGLAAIVGKMTARPASRPRRPPTSG